VFWIVLVLASADLLLVNAGPHQTEAIVDYAVRSYAYVGEDEGWRSFE
jgi:hypothetical protein